MNPIKWFLTSESLVSSSKKISCPFMSTFPEVGLSRAPMRFKRVDLPLPDGPTIETNSPLFTSKLTPSRATTIFLAETERESNTFFTLSTFNATATVVDSKRVTIHSPFLLVSLAGFALSCHVTDGLTYCFLRPSRLPYPCLRDTEAVVLLT